AWGPARGRGGGVPGLGPVSRPPARRGQGRAPASGAGPPGPSAAEGGGRGGGAGPAVALAGRVRRRSAGHRAGLTGGAPALDITMIDQLAGLGIIIAILNIFLSQAGRQEQAQMLSLAGVVIVLLWLIQLIAQLFRDVETVFRWW